MPPAQSLKTLCFDTAAPLSVQKETAQFPSTACCLKGPSALRQLHGPQTRRGLHGSHQQPAACGLAPGPLYTIKLLCPQA